MRAIADESSTDARDGKRDPVIRLEIYGILVLAFAIALVLALVSFDGHDVGAGARGRVGKVHNWLGPIGAQPQPHRTQTRQQPGDRPPARAAHGGVAARLGEKCGGCQPIDAQPKCQDGQQIKLHGGWAGFSCSH